MTDTLVINTLLAAAAQRAPEKAAVRFKEADAWKSLSYNELIRQSELVGAFLASRGFRTGDRAVILMENRPEWIVAYLGVVRFGMVAVPLDCQINVDEAAVFIRDSQARATFCSATTYRQKIAPLADGGPIETFVIAGEAGACREGAVAFADIIAAERSSDISFPSVSSDDTASLIYTSGTTGKPKGVVLTHANLCSNFRSIDALRIVCPADNFLALLPLHHTYPFMVTALVPLLLGATVTFAPPGFNPKDLAHLIREARVSILTGVPQLFTLLQAGIAKKVNAVPPIMRALTRGLVARGVRRQFGRQLRYGVSGGARLDPSTARQLTQWGVRIIEGYGLTETSPVVALNLPQQVRFGSVGQALPGVEVKIGQPDQRGEGEILVKGPNVMRGYYNNPDETRAAFQGEWFCTGDLGYLDRQGYLYITGRKKEVIVLGTGKNIYPQELEEHYGQSRYIKEICVLEKSDVAFGREVKTLFAVIVPDTDYFKSKMESNMQSRIRWEIENLGKPLPAYKHIMGFMLSSEPLPRTALNKIQRYRVMEMSGVKGSEAVAAKDAAPNDDDRRLLDDPVCRAVIDYLGGQLRRPVSLDSNLEIDLGIDSLTRVELGLGLEALFKVEIPDEVLYTVSSVRDVVTKVKELAVNAHSADAVPAGHKTWGNLLRIPLTPEVRRRVRLKPGFAGWLLELTFGITFIFMMRLFWSLKVKGKENVRRRGSFLICPNHASYLDGIAVFASLPLRTALKTYFLGYARILELPFFKWGLLSARLIPLNPDTDLVNALKAVSFVLREGKAVCVFPEGQRSIDEGVGPFKKGVGILLKELDIPVVPVYIKNSHASWPRTRRFPALVPLTVTFGAPVSAQELAALHADAGDEYEAIARGLRDRVIGLKDA